MNLNKRKNKMKNNDYEFKYIAPTSEERKEIESIRNSYITKNKSSNKLETLRKLDNKVKNTPTIISLIIGIVGTLIFGLGFTMILEWNLIAWGVVVSFIGLVVMTITYSIHVKISKYLKVKYSKEILKLSEELLNEK